MKGLKKGLAWILAAALVLGTIVSSHGAYAASGWGSDSSGWFYYKADGSYYAGQWAEIGGSWYYFLDSGYMDYAEYRNGCWLESSGVWNTAYSNGQWKFNNLGWWFEDGGWYPTSQWLWIDGYCYYFGEDGYMEYSCFRDGYWLTSSGAWDPNYTGGEWKLGEKGWYFESAGWYPADQGVWINGDYYWFDKDGYYDAKESTAKKAAGADGRTSAGAGTGNNSGNAGSGSSGNAGNAGNGSDSGNNGNGTGDTGNGNGSGNNSGADGNGSGSNGNGNSGNDSGNNGNENGGNSSGNSGNVVASYSYEIIPLLEPFSSYFYIKTDNPDPNSFSFIDEDTKYASEGETGSITPTTTIYADVKYENEETARVNGGYIATGSYVDGGTVRLKERYVIDSYPVYNMTTGTSTTEYEYGYNETDVTVEIPELMSNLDYLIKTYGDSSKSFFDNLSGISSGFGSICLYSGVYVLGDLKRDPNSYYGISSSPHVDQIYYIQDPYYRTDSKSMLMGGLYPFRYDSLGYPSMIASAAKKLDSSSTYTWSEYAHYLVDITYNGETHTYGGAGNGGGQGIHKDQIKYFFTFDGSSGDEYANISLENVRNRLYEYGALTVEDERDPSDILTWAKVREKVGTRGAYAKIALLTSVFGGSGEGYTYLYDDGSKSEGTNGWGSIGHFYNSWFDGRYFNKWEYIYPGVTFEETVKEAKESDDQVPHIFFKDFHMPLPDDGKSYYASISIPSSSGNSWSGSTRKISEEYGYNPKTGNWEGFTWFLYDKETDSWKLDEFVSYDNVRIDLGSITDYGRNELQDETYLDLKVITMDEALSMELDKNTNVEPTEYYIYDMETEPGTYHGAGNN